jgi:RsiW-degrading membrane proteinase PrsW (M82 family)
MNTPFYLQQRNGSTYPLSGKAIAIGTDRHCSIALDPRQYPDIAPYHAEIAPDPGHPNAWQIRDLGTPSGTRVNNRPVQGYRSLQPGDRIQPGRGDLEFIIEINTAHPKNRIQPVNYPFGDSLARSQLFPVLANPRDLWQKAYLVPGAITVLCVVGLFASIGNTVAFIGILGFYLILAIYYVIYRIGGKAKPWWLLVGAALMTILLLASPVLGLFELIFRQILPGAILTSKDQDIGFLAIFTRYFFGAGLMEELLKAIPIFTALAIGRVLRSPFREKIGVWEPLDGILLGTASAAGFTLVETLVQYVPDTIQAKGELAGLQLLVPRVLGAVAGHMAYSGIFGYFIGLSVLKPRKKWQILGIGYLIASLLHTLWNTVAFSPLPPIIQLFLLLAVGILSYAFLTAAIVKARQLSPDRAQNWATQFFPLPPPRLNAPFSLHLPKRALPLGANTSIAASDIPGLQPLSNNGIVAGVSANPNDPSVLGLQNHSRQVWTATIPNGGQKSIDPGRSVRLLPGTTIYFGAIRGEIR